MADLGIIKKGASTSDTYAALEDITAEIQKKGKLLLILGGTQDLTYANYLGYKKLEQTINVACIDQKIDLEISSEAPISSNNFINHLLTFQPSFLFNFSILGCQQYYISEEQLNLFDELYFDYLRLGELNNNIKLAEPYLRNSDIISLICHQLEELNFRVPLIMDQMVFLPMKYVKLLNMQALVINYQVLVLIISLKN